jgi:hypothetical protein
VHVSDLLLPEGVTAVSHEDPVIVTVVVKGGGTEAAEGDAKK